ncbi:MAG: SDR family oxidoreductase [Alphaproteobacteria bacterium]|jgi:3-hydroxybutyrate dehydrogenase|tara:strand:+ start:54 stop:791 length:738 start_codon:yes stop_codon:yes gene_type:complete
MRLENKNIVVTAAAQGIGRSTAIAFAKEGANVIATDINEEKLNEIKANHSNIETYKLDSTNKLDVENFCSSINNINILFHAVGFVHHGAILDCDSEEFQRSINVNIYSAYLMSHSLLPKMIKQKKGNIIIVSSAASSVKGVPNRFIYTTTKAALNGFVKAIAVDYIKDGIRCNAILPGTVETPSWEGRVQMADDPEQARKDFISRQAMGRLAQPNEIASMAVYLASDESDFVTGTLNLIDGGWTL